MSEIPIMKKEVEVARVIWDGTLYEGTATVKQIAEFKKEAETIRKIIVLRADLKKLKFRSEGERLFVGGWTGWEGVIAALRIALPAIGMSVGHVGGGIPDIGRRRKSEIAVVRENNGIE